MRFHGEGRISLLRYDWGFVRYSYGEMGWGEPWKHKRNGDNSGPVWVRKSSEWEMTVEGKVRSDYRRSYIPCWGV